MSYRLQITLDIKFWCAKGKKVTVDGLRPRRNDGQVSASDSQAQNSFWSRQSFGLSWHHTQLNFQTVVLDLQKSFTIFHHPNYSSLKAIKATHSAFSTFLSRERVDALGLSPRIKGQHNLRSRLVVRCHSLGTIAIERKWQSGMDIGCLYKGRR